MLKVKKTITMPSVTKNEEFVQLRKEIKNTIKIKLQKIEMSMQK